MAQDNIHNLLILTVNTWVKYHNGTYRFEETYEFVNQFLTLYDSAKSILQNDPNESLKLGAILEKFNSLHRIIVSQCPGVQGFTKFEPMSRESSAQSGMLITLIGYTCQNLWDHMEFQPPDERDFQNKFYSIYMQAKSYYQVNVCSYAFLLGAFKPLFDRWNPEAPPVVQQASQPPSGPPSVQQYPQLQPAQSYPPPADSQPQLQGSLSQQYPSPPGSQLQSQGPLPPGYIQEQIPQDWQHWNDYIGIIQRSDTLIQEYFSRTNSFQQEIQKIIQSINGYRKVSGDGNCFYRAFGYQYLEFLSQNREKLEMLIANLIEGQELYSLTEVEASANKRQILIDFLDRMKDEIDKSNGHFDSEWVYQNYKGREVLDESLIRFMRSVVFNFIQQRGNVYIPSFHATLSQVVTDEASIALRFNEYASDVILAILPLAFGIRLSIKNVISNSDMLDAIVYGETQAAGVPTFYMLYKGDVQHFDILYKLSVNS